MVTAKRPGRRANGDGLIRQRADGRWEARITLPDGRPKSVYAKTQKEAQARLQELRQQARDGRLIGTERQTVAQYLTDWLENWVKPKVRYKTYDTYAGIVRAHLIPALGRHQLSKLTAEHVQRFLNGLDRSPRTVQACRDVLRTALDRAVKRGLVVRNVASDVQPPKVERAEVRPLTREQARAIIDAFTGTPYEMPVLLGLTLGLRRGEVLGLRWSDLDLDRASLTVQRQVQVQDGEARFVPPKSKEARRTLPLPPFLVDRLRAHRTRQLEDRLAAGALWQDHDLVCASARGTPMDPMNLTHRFQERLRKAGLPHMRFHDLRHGAATVLLNNGFSLKEVQEILGHSTFRMTADIYGHVSEDARREWGDRMQQAFG
jgi:integrase